MFSVTAVVLPMIFFPSDGSIPDGLGSSAIAVYVSFPIACANVAILFVYNGWYFVALGLFAPWISDVFAYFIGSIFGKHKIVPNISPKKTLEGCIGGVLGCTAVVALFFSFFMYGVIDTKLSFATFVIASAVAGAILSIVSQLGDWMASAIKRWAGIKDFGNILPGHGGIMDRFDSAFFTLPVALVFALFLT
jgi:phosphatidate cytidylyltransferase